MLRCFAALTERHLQTLPWQALGVLQELCLQQQLPCEVTSIQQGFAGLSQLAGQCRSQQQREVQHKTQQQPTRQQSSPWCAATDALGQTACVDSQKQPAASCSPYWTQQQHLQHHKRAYSSMSSGHAHYHARHSGGLCSNLEALWELWQFCPACTTAHSAIATQPATLWRNLRVSNLKPLLCMAAMYLGVTWLALNSQGLHGGCWLWFCGCRIQNGELTYI